MFDVSFSELMLIGVIALIVIGPERLPKVARTVGHLLGRAQRYVNDVKTDIQREIDIKEIGDIKGQMEDAARSVKASMNDTQAALSQPLDEAKKALHDAQNLISPAPDAPADSPVDTSPAEPTLAEPDPAEPGAIAPRPAPADSAPAAIGTPPATETPTAPAAEQPDPPTEKQA